MTSPRSDTDLSNPSDDGCVPGTAGGKGNPDAAPAEAAVQPLEREQSAGRELSPEDARGMPGYPKDKSTSPLDKDKPSQPKEESGRKP